MPIKGYWSRGRTVTLTFSPDELENDVDKYVILYLFQYTLFLAWLDPVIDLNFFRKIFQRKSINAQCIYIEQTKWNEPYLSAGVFTCEIYNLQCLNIWHFKSQLALTRRSFQVGILRHEFINIKRKSQNTVSEATILSDTETVKMKLSNVDH